LDLYYPCYPCCLCSPLDLYYPSNRLAQSHPYLQRIQDPLMAQYFLSVPYLQYYPYYRYLQYIQSGQLFRTVLLILSHLLGPFDQHQSDLSIQ